MSKKFLLTAFSKDRPGIVADLSRVIYENGYNLEDSSMTNLAGEFAILLLLSAPSVNGVDAEEKLSTECRRLEREKGISAYIRPLRQKMPKQKSNILTNTIHGRNRGRTTFNAVTRGTSLNPVTALSY